MSVLNRSLLFKTLEWRDFPSGAVADSMLPMQGTWDSIPQQETRSHMLQLRVHMGQLKPSAAK